MADNKNITTKQDRIRVDVNDSSEVEYIHKKFPRLSHAEIVKAIRKAGPFRKAILTSLRAKDGFKS